MIIPNFPDSLLDIHHHWHRADAHPGAGPGRQHPMGTPGGGLEFLTFHRDFMAQVFNWMASQTFPQSLDVAAWTALPPEVQTAAVGWNTMLSQQNVRITTNNPPFSSADDLGTFIEVGIHSWIHGAVALAFNEEVVGTLHSPVSTYFYKIHGLVDFWWRQWEAQQKSAIKDAIDGQTNIKRIVDAKRSLKEQIDKSFKERKESLSEKIIKEKDKDLIEGGDPFGPQIDPAEIIGELSRRVTDLENQLGSGRAFIRSEERPAVGAGAQAGAAPQAGAEAGVPKVFDPAWDEEQSRSGHQ